MESAFAWIGRIIEWFGLFIPRLLILDTTQGGVKFRRGNEIYPLQAGLHLYWPIITVVKVWPIARQTIDLTAQTFETKDGHTILVSGMIAYRVDDVEALMTSVYEPDNTVRDIAMAIMQQVLIQYTWEELRNGMVEGALKRELTREANRELKNLGLKILSVGIKDLARTRVYKVALEQSTDGLH
jgi:regulator of protease activity HflC (stomatin/prohibitin superfamily)